MKRISIYLNVLPLVAFLTFSGCNREKDVAPNTPACKPVKQTIHSVDGTEPDTHIAVEYNAQEKLSRVSVQTEGLTGQYSLLEYGPTGHLVKLTAYYSDGQVSNYQVYEYNQAGRLVKVTYHDADGTVSNTFTLEYDSNGNRVKTVSQSNASGTEQASSTTYEYAGGNVVRSTDTGGLFGGMVTEYEYYLDRENKLSTYEEIVYGEVSSRNLLKKRTRTFPKSIEGFMYTSEFTYEYNDKGFPTKVISTSKNNQMPGIHTTEALYEYQCR
jgi:hypothetical protein